MGRIVKSLSLTLILIINLTIVGTAYAQTITKPTVPQFTLRYVKGEPYDLPPRNTSSIDPYTGKVTTTTVPGYRVDNISIQIIIENQEYKGNFHLYYNYSYKEHIENEWKYHKTGNYSWNSPGPSFDYQSASDYTVISFPDFPKEGQMDFRVQAQIGYYNETIVNLAHPGAAFREYIFIGEVSGWSEIQTITIGETISSTPTSSVPEFSSFIIPLLLTIMVASAGLLVNHKKHKHNSVKEV
jgi:hypothetical protein